MTTDTTTSAAWPKDADVISVRMVPAHVPTYLTVTIDEAHRYRRMIRRINGKLP